MTARRWPTIALALALPATAVAQPSLTIDGCGFEPDELLRALAQEGAPALAVDVRCTADGTATLTVDPAGAARRREVDLRDVPASLAPRVIALMVTAVAGEIPPPAPPPPAPPPPARPPPPSSLPIAGPRDAPIDRPALAEHRPALLDRATAWPRAATGRVLVRSYAGLPLWGGGVGAAIGPVTVGVHAAATSLVHRLGDATPWLAGLDVGVTLACSHGRPTTCVGARGELSRQAVAAAATGPTVMATAISTVAVHGDAELSVSLPIAGVEITATAAVGVGSGLVARANSVEIARLAGWTMGAALEVRR
ncbi:MAG: hypothetical protein IPH44_19805 [Myxococcales bacterium]|nr:hypothetical protein [Myxococcales bacterium]MBK7195094.1 hypothetical protein [Myxococcales bacterium]MBP6843995.1 hypothetical protein [Kofleriaceae bacterium]